MKCTLLNFNDLFNPANLITNHEPVNKSTKKFNPDGVFSEKIFGRLDSEGTEYSCQCGYMRGRFYSGETCIKCGTEVDIVDPLITKQGWIDLEGNFLINPLFYRLLQKIIGRVKLFKIVNYGKHLDKDGITILDNTDSDDKTAYKNEGLVFFKENFTEILDYYMESSKYQYKDKVYRLITENIDKVFIDKILVYSAALRPALTMGESVIIDALNNDYNHIIKYSNLIKKFPDSEKDDIKILPILLNMQLSYNKIFDKILDNIKSKEGFIRNHVLSHRLNFTSRTVITPLMPGHDLHEIHIPYLAFLELYKFHILNLLVKLKNINHLQAHGIWSRACVRRIPEVDQIIKDLIHKTNNGIQVLLNRNPTINFGSFMKMQITDIKWDLNDLTTSINNLILKPLNADYDGDVLNILCLNEQELYDTFDIFDPRQMMISRENGRFNSSMLIDKDIFVAIFALNN